MKNYLKMLQIFKSKLPFLITMILYISLGILVASSSYILLSKDYGLILNIAEFLIIGSGTLALLSFTYALSKTPKDKNYKDIIYAGEHLLISTITIVIGLIIIPGVGYIIDNHQVISSDFGRFALIYDAFLAIYSLFILIAGMFSLVISLLFFTSGIGKLIHVLLEGD